MKRLFDYFHDVKTFNIRNQFLNELHSQNPQFLESISIHFKFTNFSTPSKNLITEQSFN